MPPRRILYAGDDNALAAALRERLRRLDCDVIRSPVARVEKAQGVNSLADAPARLLRV